MVPLKRWAGLVLCPSAALTSTGSVHNSELTSRFMSVLFLASFERFCSGSLHVWPRWRSGAEEPWAVEQWGSIAVWALGPWSPRSAGLIPAQTRHRCTTPLFLQRDRVLTLLVDCLGLYFSRLQYKVAVCFLNVYHFPKTPRNGEWRQQSNLLSQASLSELLVPIQLPAMAPGSSRQVRGWQDGIPGSWPSPHRCGNEVQDSLPPHHFQINSLNNFRNRLKIAISSVTLLKRAAHSLGFQCQHKM